MKYIWFVIITIFSLSVVLNIDNKAIKYLAGNDITLQVMRMSPVLFV